MGRGRAQGMGRRIATRRTENFSQAVNLELPTLPPLNAGDRTPEQELALLKKYAKTLNAQLREVNFKIGELAENREVRSLAAEIDTEKCIGCLRCTFACPFEAIVMLEGSARVDRSKCTGCGQCISICPEGAISLRR